MSSAENARRSTDFTGSQSADDEALHEGEDRLGAYEDGIARLAAAIEAAAQHTDKWDHAVSAGLRGGLDLLAADPPLARVLLVEPLMADGDARRARERSLGRLADALRPPVELTGGEPVSDEILRLQAGGLASYLWGRVLAGEAERLPEDHGALLEYLLAFSAPPG